jgi:hypothetical protein
VAGVISTKPGISLAKRPTKFGADAVEYGESNTIFECCDSQSSLVVSLSLDNRNHAPLLLSLTNVSKLTVSLVSGFSDRDSRPLLALIGRVPVKATTETGPIRIGDILTSSSKPGYAMRCSKKEICEGNFIGKALETLEYGEGLILMLITR